MSYRRLLRELLADAGRCASLVAEHDGIVLDYTRQKVTLETMKMLYQLADAAKLDEKIAAMAQGQHINKTEDRAVMHLALRAPKSASFIVDGKDVVPDVHQVLDRIYAFADGIRSGNNPEHLGATGKKLTNVISIGIGGSYLGPEFVFEALKTDPHGHSQAKGRTLRFLANVDPVDVLRATDGLDPETTLVVVVSKTFTTAETMLNAKTLRNWLLKGMSSSNQADVINRHMIAVSANVPAAKAFGINPNNVFGFWDWVGGRYSVCSAVGVVPLALQYGSDIVREFLAGAYDMDCHFLQTKDHSKNLPVLMGLIGVWNSTFLNHGVRAILPYSQALLRFPAHIQQVDMESNGKRVTLDGTELPFEAGEVHFGEPGTNGQHSFYQLIHQGRVVPCEFIGACKSQHPIDLTQSEKDIAVSNHDELMSNFFAQPDALAIGTTIDELEKEGVPAALRSHKEFPGNRMSLSILFPCFDAKRIGQLLSLYENRVAVQGFIWGIASFDQWGVEKGKVMAKIVQTHLAQSRKQGNKSVANNQFNAATSKLIERYLNAST